MGDDLSKASYLELRLRVDAALMKVNGFDDLATECLRRAEEWKASRESQEEARRRNDERVAGK